MKKIEFFHHNIDREDRARVSEVLQSIFLTTGSYVQEFEAKFSEYLRLNNTIGVTSCTAGLHLSLIALGIGPGDEVITTPMSFCATANAILHIGAKPIFIDVEEETGNLNAELIESALSKRTRAIIPVHLYGQMCDMKTLRLLANRYKLKIVEDAAHAIEATRNGIPVGHLADTACFSFYATKNITSGEGGAVSTNSSRTAALLRMLRLHGIDRSAADRYTKRYKHWDMPVLGWKYNMDNIQGALLLGQLKRIESLWKKRDTLWRFYEEELRSVSGVRVLKTLPELRHARHLFTVLVPPAKRDALLRTLQNKGVGVAVNYRPIHLLRFYRKTFGHKSGDYPVAEDIGRRTISLPLYPSLRITEAKYVIRVFKESIAA